jgi:hypothetical protein
MIFESSTLCFVQMLENLVVAVESEAQIVDIGRVSGFMQKVCHFLFPSSSLTTSLGS